MVSRIVKTYGYRDETGAVLFEVVRYEPKKFLQRQPNGKGGWLWNIDGVRQVPYRLPELRASGDAVVYVVEGEKDCDRLADFGLTATCNAGGAGKWREAHAQHLEGRRVVILPDNDDTGRKHAHQVAASLKNVATDVRILELPNLPHKGDASDWLDAGGTAEELQRHVDAPPPAGAGMATTIAAEMVDEQDRKRGQTHMLVDFARGQFDFLHDNNAEVYAKDKATGELRRLASRAFRDKLVAGFYERTRMAPRDQSLSEALSTLRALGRFNGDPQPVNMRVAATNGHYYIDMGETGKSRAIEVDASGWRVVEKAPVLFVRGDALEPIRNGGDVEAVWEFVNVPEEQRLLVLAWLLDCMRPDTPFPGLELHGEQGSGKSDSSKYLRRLIDPNACLLRGAPKSSEDIFVAALQSHLVAYENISHLMPAMQDALCILSTGGGHAKRQLYTDADEHVINVQRPWLINGISICATQQDLVDRCISVECPSLTERKSSSEQKTAFEAALPGIVCALLNLFARALKVLPDQKLPPDARPRLLEYALLGMAVAVAMGKDADDFMVAFNTMRREAVSRTIDASPAAGAVVAYMEKNSGGIRGPDGKGAALNQVLHTLEQYRPPGAEAWPRTAKGLGDALRRAAPALRQLGIEVTSHGKGSGGVVRYTVAKKVAEAKSHKSQVPPAAPPGLGTSGTSAPQVFLDEPSDDDAEAFP